MRWLLDFDVVFVDGFVSQHCHRTLILLRYFWPVHLFDILSVVLNLLIVLSLHLGNLGLLLLYAEHLSRRSKLLKSVVLTGLERLESGKLLTSLALCHNLGSTPLLDLVFTLQAKALILECVLCHVLLLKGLVEGADLLQSLLLLFEGQVLVLNILAGHHLVERLLVTVGLCSGALGQIRCVQRP